MLTDSSPRFRSGVATGWHDGAKVSPGRLLSATGRPRNAVAEAYLARCCCLQRASRPRPASRPKSPQHQDACSGELGKCGQERVRLGWQAGLRKARSGLGQAWVRLGSGLGQAWVRFGSGQVWGGGRDGRFGMAGLGQVRNRQGTHTQLHPCPHAGFTAAAAAPASVCVGGCGPCVLNRWCGMARQLW